MLLQQFTNAVIDRLNHLSLNRARSDTASQQSDSSDADSEYTFYVYVSHVLEHMDDTETFSDKLIENLSSTYHHSNESKDSFYSANEHDVLSTDDDTCADDDTKSSKYYSLSEKHAVSTTFLELQHKLGASQLDAWKRMRETLRNFSQVVIQGTKSSPHLTLPRASKTNLSLRSYGSHTSASRPLLRRVVSSPIQGLKEKITANSHTMPSKIISKLNPSLAVPLTFDMNELMGGDVDLLNIHNHISSAEMNSNAATIFRNRQDA
jgi:hypothetical protein